MCALCVCLFHFRIAGIVDGSPYIWGNWLFVDFFFVMSGFVMACSWGNRLGSLNDVSRFAILRFGRVYPLHFVMLLMFLAVELVGALLVSEGLMLRQPFDASHPPAGWLASAFLVHIFGLFPGLVWNIPSWSIAAEFWTYLVFAGAVLWGKGNARIALAALGAGSLAVLSSASEQGINVTHEYALWRCIYGFSVGALVWHWTVDGRRPAGGNWAEIAVIALVVLFVTYCRSAPENLLAPLVFGLAVHVFAAESGWISSQLFRTWPQRLGLWSYSIYMVHVFVQSRLDDGIRLVFKLGQRLKIAGFDNESVTSAILGSQPMVGLALSALMLLVVIAVAGVTYRLVELPGQRLARQLADRLPDLSSRLANRRGAGHSHEP